MPLCGVVHVSHRKVACPVPPPRGEEATEGVHRSRPDSKTAQQREQGEKAPTDSKRCAFFLSVILQSGI